MRPERGSVLLIVLGLLATILASVISFLALMRADAEEAALLIGQARARIMLVAACQYLQESARLGWCPLAPEQLATDPDAEPLSLQQGFGWTDIRDGSLGPRGPQPSPAPTPPAWWPSNRIFHAELRPPMASWPAWNAQRPPSPPWWWRRSWPPYPATEHVRDSDLPPAGDRVWPCPGAVVRIESFVMERPPAAVMPYATCNPAWPIPRRAMLPNEFDPGKVQWDAHLPESSTASDAPWPGMYYPLMAKTWGNHLGTRTLDAPNDVPAQATGTGFGALDPQPVVDTWNDFARGDALPRVESLNQSWFRLYRELPSDHDNDGNPWYDRVPLRGHGVFIIACGAGGSLGFRFWDTAEAGFSRDLELLTASESNLFPDRRTFELLRERSQVLWFRVQWSGASGGGFDGLRNSIALSRWQTDPWGGDAPIQETHGATIGVDTYPGGPISAFTGMQVRMPSSYGHMAWIQRLDREPPRW